VRNVPDEAASLELRRNELAVGLLEELQVAKPVLYLHGAVLGLRDRYLILTPPQIHPARCRNHPLLLDDFNLIICHKKITAKYALHALRQRGEAVEMVVF